MASRELTLGQTQELFASCLASLILRLNELHYGVRMGECYRTAEQAALYAARGIGIKNSVHCERLGADLILSQYGEVLTRWEDYGVAGGIWKSLNLLARWGGDFERLRDGQHFSFEYQGRA